jgi:polysaccharide export outer membrane protein
MLGESPFIMDGRILMFARAFLAVSLAFALSACAYRPPEPASHELLTEPYRFDSGDRLKITVFDQPSLSSTYLVDQAGYISVPLIGGVPARGKTAPDLEKAIADKLRKGYLRTPDVTVDIDQYRPFFIMGEVKSGGQYPYVAGMTVQNAIAIAGGYSVRASQDTADITRQLNGEVVTGRVRITDPIRPGDTIYVRERFF